MVGKGSTKVGKKARMARLFTGAHYWRFILSQRPRFLAQLFTHNGLFLFLPAGSIAHHLSGARALYPLVTHSILLLLYLMCIMILWCTMYMYIDWNRRHLPATTPTNEKRNLTKSLRNNNATRIEVKKKIKHIFINDFEEGIFLSFFLAQTPYVSYGDAVDSINGSDGRIDDVDDAPPIDAASIWDASSNGIQVSVEMDCVCEHACTVHAWGREIVLSLMPFFKRLIGRSHQQKIRNGASHSDLFNSN